MASTSVSKSKKAPASAEDSSAFGPIAERFRRAGDLERAVSLCRDGLQKFPHHISARVTLGWALLELGKFDEAQVELEQVLRRRPDNLAAIRALAELHDRSEQTLNLPMDGPGQWPPTEDAVEEAASSAVAGNFSSLASGLDDGPAAAVAAEPEPEAPAYQPEPAVAAAPDAGPAMWSALPPPEPSVVPHLVQVESIGVTDADIAALIAEAESLDASAVIRKQATADIAGIADVEIEHPVQFRQAADGQFEAGADLPLHQAADVEYRTTAEAESRADVLLEATADIQLDASAEVSLESLAAAQFAGTVEAEPAAVVLDAGSDLSVFEDAAYQTPEQFSVSVSDDVVFQVDAVVEPEAAIDDTPGFQLEGVSVAAIEAESGLLAHMESGQVAEDASAFDPDLQPVFDFDKEPIVPVAAAVVVEPEPAVASIASAEPELAPAPIPVTEPVAARSPIAALEGFLGRVQARRRQLMTESVA